MTTPRVVVFAFLLAGSTSRCSAADVVAAPLDADSIAQMQQSALLGAHRAAPGDVLLANDSFQVVVFAQPLPNDKGRVGRILFLSPTAGEETFVFEGGPINDWERGELGRGNQLALVRFQRQGPGWSAELVVQMPEKTSWLEVTTTIQNSGENTLEIPMVDVVRGPSAARAADDRKGTIAIGNADAPTLAILRTNGQTSAAQAKKGEWFLGHPSSDARANPVARFGKKILRIGKPDSNAPIEADEAWSGDMKDRKNWHRIPAGQTRTIHRRLVFGATGTSLRPTLAAAAKTAAPNLQFVPAGKSIAERTRQLVRRPPNQPPAAKAEATPIPTEERRAAVKPTASSPPANNAPTVKVKPVSDAPKVLSDSIDDIGKLPDLIK